MVYPKISVITVVYNNAAHIEEALKSVLSQTYTNIEYIVIDGGSTDGTVAILERYRGKIHRLISEPDHGIYDALNKGIQIASGDVIGFLHSDDRFASDLVLLKIAQGFQTGKIDGVYSDLEYFQNEKVLRYWKSSAFSPELLSRGWMPPHPTLYITKAVYSKIGKFNLDYQISADYDFILRMFSDTAFRFKYLPEVTIQMRTGGVSNRNLARILQKMFEDLKILKRNGYSCFFGLMVKNFSKIGQLFARRVS